MSEIIEEKQINELFLSIIVPVYNCERYLNDCLDSCIEQDIPIDNYEVIAIDDCSTDDSLKIMRQYENDYENIHVIALPFNQGVSAARNAGLELMRGKYCMFLDGDDFINDNCIGKCFQLLNNGNLRTVLCFGYWMFFEQGYRDRHKNYLEGKYLTCKPSSGYITNRIIPSYYASQLRFQENVYYGEDEVYTFELGLFGLDTIELDEPIYYYRKHKNSACEMTPEKRIKRLDSLINSAVYLKETYDLNRKEVSGFYNHRIKMTLDLLVYVGFKDKWYYLSLLRKLDLLSHYTYTTKSPKNPYCLYFKHSLKVNRMRVKRKLIRQKTVDK